MGKWIELITIQHSSYIQGVPENSEQIIKKINDIQQKKMTGVFFFQKKSKLSTVSR